MKKTLILVLALFGCWGTTRNVVTTFESSDFLIDVVDISYVSGPLEVTEESVSLKIRGEDSEIPVRLSRYAGFQPASEERKIYGTVALNKKSNVTPFQRTLVL